MREEGVPVKRIAKHLDRQNSSFGGSSLTTEGGDRLHDSVLGCAPPREELEEISQGLAAGLSIRPIAQGLERSPSTVCREVDANGGATSYRALQADLGAQLRALRRKRAKLSQCRRFARSG